MKGVEAEEAGGAEAPDAESGEGPLPDRDNVLQLASVEEIPEPLRPLQDAGMAAWKRAWREARAWLAPSDAVTVLAYCEAIDDYVQLRGSLRRRGFDEVTEWRLRKQVIDFGDRVTRLAASLGLSPSARAQLGVAEVRTAEGVAYLMERESKPALMDREVIDIDDSDVTGDYVAPTQ